MAYPLRADLKVLRLTEAFRIAHGVSQERTVLRVFWDGAVGEAPFVPYYHENPEEALSWLQALTWTGGPPPESGPRAARLALDLLWHDHLGRAAGKPLYQMWDLDPSLSPPGCRSLGIPTDLDEFILKVEDTAQKFPVLKLKLGSGNLAFDEEIVAQARAAAPEATIFADVNGGWSVPDAAALIPRLATYGLSFVEQPIHHKGGVEAWRELRRLLRQADCVVNLYADESAQTAADIPALAGLVEGVNVKLLKAGSFAGAKRMIQEARAHGLKVMLGCMIESTIGVTAAAHLAPIVDGIDLDGHLYLAEDDYTGIRYSGDGELILPEKHGLGVEPKVGA